MAGDNLLRQVADDPVLRPNPARRTEKNRPRNK